MRCDCDVEDLISIGRLFQTFGAMCNPPTTASISTILPTFYVRFAICSK